MTTALGEPCPTCGKAPVIRFTTNGAGRVVEEVRGACDCAEREAAHRALCEERRRLRLCRECAVSIAHQSPRTTLCPECRAHSDATKAKRHRARNGDAIRKREREYQRKRYRKHRKAERKRRMEAYYRNHDAEKAKARKRARPSHPAYLARLEKQRAYYRKNAEANRAKAKARYWAKRDEILAKNKEQRDFARAVRQRARQPDRKAA